MFCFFFLDEPKGAHGEDYQLSSVDIAAQQVENKIKFNKNIKGVNLRRLLKKSQYRFRD
ncbi:hypothetical protein KHA80_18110 [Anaerobacillus sp. HL2]|nr:hypothetical protein KHA80_18110 [Anaerobacillus sp. HL2]